MKIVIINNADLNAIPPVRNLLDVLIDLGHNVVLVSGDKENALEAYQSKGVKTYLLKELPNNVIGKVLYFIKRRRYIREIVKFEMSDGDLLWAASDKSALDIGLDLLKKYKSVFQQFELVEDIPLYGKPNLIMADLKKYAKSAWKIVIPEYNRAHIVKIWWDLKETPIILPNKPYRLPPLEIPFEIECKLKKLKEEKRKILLYLGIFNPDRDLELIVDAVSEMQDYVLYLIGRKNEYLDKLLNKKKNVENIEYIEYIQPPYHICAGRYANLALLPYKPTKELKAVSELNSLYCAPNKIYEYASQGLPMIGPDIPGLKFPFELYKIGECYQENSISSVIHAIHKIESNIEEYKANCLKFWNSDNIVDIIRSIIGDR